ncbi:MAG: hypothetical protein DMG39_11940 [Acidobacteria bacterium]|nr:MAG: hypothetical protein DMG39_11940 [Acidobacteriota bacterium]
MKNPHRFLFATLASLMLVAALWAMPPAIDNAQPAATAQTPASQLSVSGKITAVRKDSFTLAVAGGQASSGQQFAQEAPNAKSMVFQIDKNTTIEGKLKVNATADVTYREENGKNIAISVHVTA